jgi:hypothetical protein
MINSLLVSEEYMPPNKKCRGQALTARENGGRKSTSQLSYVQTAKFKKMIYKQEPRTKYYH